MLHHVQLSSPVGSEAESRAFFAGLLAMTEVAKPTALSGRGGCWFRAPGIELHMGTEDDFRPAGKAHPAIRVGNLEAVRATLSAAGHPTTQIDSVEIAGYRRFYSADPHGNRIEFLTEAPREWSLADAHTVRRARGSDVAAIAALLRDDPLGADRETAEPATYRTAFDRIDADPQQFLAVVIDPTGALVGTCQLTFTTTLSRNAATRMTIEAVRIAAAARGSGLGRALLQWALGYGQQAGASLAQLTTDASRTDAQRFYAGLGFTASHVGMKRELS